ncbi:MAG: isoprenylcysteine carboxylmethyltransferase family protein [Pseudomonadota bacterium]
MAIALHWLGLLLLMLCFLRISVASVTHFDRARSALGMTLVRVLSLAATLWLGSEAATKITPASPWSSALTLIFTLCALALLETTLRQTSARTLDVAFTDHAPETLVTEGVFRLVRNPFYASYLIYWAAWIPATAGGWAAWAVLALFIAIYAQAVRGEERILATKFGAAYAEYKSRTGRFIPKVTGVTKGG